MKRLSPDGKTAIIMQAINRGSRGIAEIAALNNIGKSTLTRWVRQYKLGIAPRSKTSKSNVAKDNKSLNAEQKFRHITVHPISTTIKLFKDIKGIFVIK